MFGFMVVAAAGAWQACDSNARYVDPNTGNALNLREDSTTGLLVDAETGAPVSLYVDTKTNDTIYGKTGKVVNGKVTRNETDGKVVYVYTDVDNNAAYQNKSGETKEQYENGEYKLKRGDDYKKEVEKDGDITIKDGDTKIKIDGETGERKVKKDD